MSQNKPNIGFASSLISQSFQNIIYFSAYNIKVSRDDGAGAVLAARVPRLGLPGQAQHHLGHALGHDLQDGGEHEAGVQHKQPMVPLYLGNAT